MTLHLPGRVSPDSSRKQESDGVPNGILPIEGIRKPIRISHQEVQLFSNFIYGVCGIHIEASKAYLLETRLGKIMESESCTSFTDFYHRIKGDTSRTLQNQVVDAITTNETLFFRDTSPFDLLKFKILPEVIDKSARISQLPVPIRIWSAACSTGQELYSIAIVLRELLGDLGKYNIKLLGTDISDTAIKQASYGAYNKFEIERGLPRDRLQRHFETSGGYWKIRNEIRSMVVFRKMNLMESLSSLGKFDVIFCRNVAIYFKLEDRKKLFDKIADCLDPDGFLIIGSTESLTGICPQFIPKRHLKSIFYQLR
jgi:chemotaxis protein methyltransferase CheR